MGSEFPEIERREKKQRKERKKNTVVVFIELQTKNLTFAQFSTQIKSKKLAKHSSLSIYLA